MLCLVCPLRNGGSSSTSSISKSSSETKGRGHPGHFKVMEAQRPEGGSTGDLPSSSSTLGRIPVSSSKSGNSSFDRTLAAII